ncbi:hypothetical protein E2C01_063910 [Portunus trituberculatus]|uniref:Uncharacterized protein n=1 Tax=Portunus trituberculatus TaxID=210409 RepID=A0A5B7HBR4_PORTR|nr:hypothetical protein [Portunus trituberculatus]
MAQGGLPDYTDATEPSRDTQCSHHAHSRPTPHLEPAH